jgi:large subunit ribosomal protein L27
MLLKQFLNKNISLTAKLNFNAPTMTSNNSFTNFQFFNFATKMRQGVTKNKKDSAGRRLGLKKFGGEEVRESQIIVRQRGFKYKAGENVHFGKDQTLHSSKEGIVKYTRDPTVNYRRVFVNVVEQEIPNRKVITKFLI